MAIAELFGLVKTVPSAPIDIASWTLRMTMSWSLKVRDMLLHDSRIRTVDLLE
jgi:hypothetical protein